MTVYNDERYMRLVDIVNEATVIDAHTHIQDDLPDFSEEMIDRKLAGTQASYRGGIWAKKSPMLTREVLFPKGLSLTTMLS